MSYPGLSPTEAADPRRVANVVSRMNRGKLDCTSAVTLTPNAVSTDVADVRVTMASVILLCPLTANAAAAMATTYVSARANGTGFTLSHANSGQTDRDFAYAILG